MALSCSKAIVRAAARGVCPTGLALLSLLSLATFTDRVAMAQAGPSSAEPAASQPVEVTVRGKQTQAQSRRGSAEAVTVVDTRRAQKQARALGDVLEGVEGVLLRRTGGLGSATRFSLNGLQDEQVPFFLDEVPLDVVGNQLGVASMPVIFERIELYRGVLPVRFGAEHLGGGVNLVTNQDYKPGASASYQRGSFGTHRALLFGRYRHQPSGFFIGAIGSFDRARNDYDVEVDVADKTGRVQPTFVKRLHDDYLAYGGSLELGVADRPAAKRLIFRLFGSTFRKELQHNSLMTVPYGEVENSGTVFGATALYEQPLLSNLDLTLVAAASHRTIELLDTSQWIYDWYGRRVNQGAPGEVRDEPHDVTLWQQSLFGRAQLEWRVVPEHSLRLASTARFFARNGHERIKTIGVEDPAGRRALSNVMTGLEYELNAFDLRAPEERAATAADVSRDLRLQNIAFVKHYFFGASSNHPVSGDLAELHIDEHRFGLGDGLRFRFTEWLLAKASYEWVTRFPSMDQLYGDGVLLYGNSKLEPETSHNANVELRLDLRRTAMGRFTAVSRGFFRDTDRLIKLFPDPLGRGSQYDNVYRVRSLGVEGSLSWAPPGDWVVLDGNATWLDLRNTSKEEPWAQYEGDRIPNAPWLFVNWSGQFQWRAIITSDDDLSPFYVGRYVHEFFRLWESIGNPQFKAKVPSQVVHLLGLTYTIRAPARIATTFQVDNLTDEKLYDSFGVQRPGRAFAVKVTGDI
jgi:vitamin B12 transporter